MIEQLLSKAIKNIKLHKAAGDLTPVVAELEPMVIATPDSCHMGWCRVEVDGYKGWISKKSIWGVYENENLD